MLLDVNSAALVFGTGEWLVATRYDSWEVYGKVQEAVAKGPAFAKLMAQAIAVAELRGYNIAVGVDL
jgi:hypothetical protein